MPKQRPLKLEQKILKDLHAVPHANSGAMAKKHDGSTVENLIEIKTTQAASFRVENQYWQLLKIRAITRSRQAALVVAFDHGGVVDDMEKVVVIDYEYFKELVNTEDYDAD